MTSSPWPLADEVHLYTLALSVDPAELTSLAAALSASEIARGDVLLDAAVRRRFLAGRGLLREILGGYLGMAAKAVSLAVGAHGKPLLAGAAQGLRFNLAHSGEIMLLAVASGCEVGVDIERIDPDKPFAKMAKLVLSVGEQEQLSRWPEPVRLEAFHRFWVGKEACLKGCGRGFSLAASCFDLTLPAVPAAVMTRCDRRFWQVLELETVACHTAALAIERSGPEPGALTVARLDHRRSWR
jgi:4'-phosphopantetheinyl transferase